MDSNGYRHIPPNPVRHYHISRLGTSETFSANVSGIAFWGHADSNWLCDRCCPGSRFTYGRRWSIDIEDLFNQLKNRWGWKETWQQSRQVLHRWVQILSASYAIPQLLVLFDDIKVDALASLAPWLLNQPVTAGKVQQGMQWFLAMAIFGRCGTRSPLNSDRKNGNFLPTRTTPRSLS